MTASVCECPLCQATFQATSEMAGSAVQCPGCARLLQLPLRIGGATPQVCQAIRIDVCECPKCNKGFGYTTQMLGSLVACPHCGSSFQLTVSGQLGRELENKAAASGAEGQQRTQPPLPSPAPLKAKKQRFREADDERLPARSGPEEKSPVAGNGADEPPRIETGKTSAQVVPPEEIRIELAKPANSNEQAARAATPPSSGPRSAKPAVPKAEPRRSQLGLTSGERSPRNPVKSPEPIPNAQPAASPATLSSPVLPVEPPALPPVFAGAWESGRKPDEPVRQPGEPGMRLAADSRQVEAAAAQLLPPRFYSSDPTIIRQPKNRSESAFVLLPDATGGFQRVNNTVIRIQHEGETIVLAAPDPAKVRRRRWIVNLTTLVICLGILYLVFRWLLH